MAPKYTLTYFNSKGLAEVTRLMFAYGKSEYEDKRFDDEEWQINKPKMPTGKIPVLEVDGKMICQSGAIERFVAREFGLYGKDNFENTQMDVVLDTIRDIRNPVLQIIFGGGNDDTKEAELAKYEEETGQASVQTVALEKMLENRDDGDGFLGKELTVADIAIQNMLESLSPVAAKVFTKKKLRKLFALKERVEKIPQIAEWMKKRPVTQY